jgi:hypothetical protein
VISEEQRAIVIGQRREARFERFSACSIDRRLDVGDRLAREREQACGSASFFERDPPRDGRDVGDREAQQQKGAHGDPPSR